jgi:hypothetical protein
LGLLPLGLLAGLLFVVLLRLLAVLLLVVVLQILAEAWHVMLLRVLVVAALVERALPIGHLSLLLRLGKRSKPLLHIEQARRYLGTSQLSRLPPRRRRLGPLLLQSVKQIKRRESHNEGSD